MGREIISKFKDRPKTKIAWRAMWLGLSTLLIPPLLGISAAVIVPMVGRFSNEIIGSTIGLAVALLAVFISITALVTSIQAFKTGERSWVLWVGLIPASLVVAFWIFMIAGEFLFPH